jgi:hypothetical protein
MGKDIRGFGITLASPCQVSWDSMSGDERIRFCSLCKKNVYELSGMSRAEVLRLLERKPDACARFFVRTDGTVLTDDCPVGLRLMRKSYLWAKAKTVAAATALLGVLSGVGWLSSGPDWTQRVVDESLEPTPSQKIRGAFTRNSAVKVTIESRREFPAARRGGGARIVELENDPQHEPNLLLHPRRYETIEARSTSKLARELERTGHADHRSR